MSEYAQTGRASTTRSSAVAHAAQQRGRADTPFAARGHAPTRQDALAESLNQSARVQSLVQTKQMLHDSPRMQSQRALQGALNPGFGSEAIQSRALPDEEELAQAAFEPAQRQADSAAPDPIVQLVYLWDRTSGAKAPHWVDEQQPPEGYLHSGRYDDREHGDDELYTRLGGSDLFYGINYDDDSDERMTEFNKALQEFAKNNNLNIDIPQESNRALRLYVKAGLQPVIDVEIMNSLYGGSSGWARYYQYLSETSKIATAAALKELNPDLPWTTDVTGAACQVAMVEALKETGSVRFLLDGMHDIKGTLEGTGKWSGNVTAHELRFAMALLNKPVKVAENSVVTPKDGENVFFYLNRQLISAATVRKLEGNEAAAKLESKEKEEESESEEVESEEAERETSTQQTSAPKEEKKEGKEQSEQQLPEDSSESSETESEESEDEDSD